MKFIDALLPLGCLAVMYGLAGCACWMMSASDYQTLVFRSHITFGAAVAVLASIPVCLLLIPFYAEWRSKQ